MTIRMPKILWEKFSKSYARKLHGKDVNDINPGSGYLRISLVEKKELLKKQ